MEAKPIFRMSESGKCSKTLSAKLLGYRSEPAPVWLETAANEGKWHEERIVGELRKRDNVYNRQGEITLNYPGFTLVGHIDGIIEDYDHQRVAKLLEIKSMSQFEFDRWMRDGFKGFPSYAAQITCYMEATGLNECLYIVKNRSSGYENRRVLTEKPMHMTEIIGNLTEATNYALASELVPKDFDPQSIGCRRCEYKHLCVPEAKELTSVKEAGLNAATDDWRAGKALVERGKYLVEKAREVFEGHTKATNILKWQHSGLAIQLVHFSEQKTYPKSKLFQHFTEEQLEPACQIKEAYDQLRINDLEADND